MKRLLEIETCHNCKNWIHGNLVDVERCYLTMRVTPTPPDCPDWCPLPSAEPRRTDGVPVCLECGGVLAYGDAPKGNGQEYSCCRCGYRQADRGTIPAAAPAPEQCVWRCTPGDGIGWIPSCKPGLAGLGWTHCPWCGRPIKLEEQK